MSSAAALAERMQAKPAGDGWLARCPAHEDQRASLSIGVGQDGRVLLNCHAGCATEAVLSAVGLTFADLKEQVVTTYNLPERVTGKDGKSYPYTDEHGTLLYEVLRLEPKDFRQRRPDGKGGWAWSLNGTRRVLFKLAELKGKATIYIPEGEKDVENLWAAGLPATCNSGGAGKWRQDYTEQLTAAGVQNIVILPDNDDPGRQHARTIAASCQTAGLNVKVVELPEVPAKGDVSDYLASHTKADLAALVKSTASYNPISTPEKPSALPYQFTPAFAPEHLVSSYIDYAAQRTDAAYEFHEALGLALIAAASTGTRAFLGPYPNGIPTNLYALLGGDSTTSRKSSALDTARDIQERAVPGSVLAESSTPEALVETLAKRSRKSSTLFVDEFAELLTKIEKTQYMAGLKGLLLTLYSGNNYTAQRRSKGSTGQKTEDADIIERPHLSIVGAVTPTIFQRLAADDVTSGLLARFAIVWPLTKPERRPFYEVGHAMEARREDLVAWLRSIHQWASSEERRARFEPEALRLLDEFSQRLESEAVASGDEPTKALFQRLMPMSLKIAICSALGRIGVTDSQTVMVTVEDAASALVVLERWRTYAAWFAGQIGQNDLEKRLQRCLAVLQTRGGRTKRTQIARHAHLSKRELDAVEETLADRGLIQVDHEQASSGPATKFWTLVEEA